MTQKAMAEVFDVNVSAINKYISLNETENIEKCNAFTILLPIIK